jgi:hypothetical protein
MPPGLKSMMESKGYPTYYRPGHEEDEKPIPEIGKSVDL